jgi:2-(1,2-epoxy-1,2-dihydrophenyl)acetyl-CoA isomerase
VNGPAAGAGMSFACACDLRIAADSASFVPAFINIGLVPDSGGSYFVTRILGPARAFEWLTSGRKLSAAEAHAWGLVSEVVETDALVARAAEVAAQLAALPTRAIGMTKRLIDHALNATLERQLEREAELQTAATQTEDFREGVAAFLEKRPPQFRGNYSLLQTDMPSWLASALLLALWSVALGTTARTPSRLPAFALSRISCRSSLRFFTCASH